MCPQFWFQIDYWPHCLGYLSELRRTEYNRKLKLQNQQSESGYDLNEGDIQINHEDFLTTETFGKEKCSGEIKNKKFVTCRIKLFSSLVMENGSCKD